jgi:hypothetical protein
MEKKNEKSRSEKSIHEGDIYVEWMEPATGDVTSNETPQEINTSRKEHIFCNGFGCQYSFANRINKSRTKSAGDGDVLYCRDTELAKTFVWRASVSKNNNILYHKKFLLWAAGEAWGWHPDGYLWREMGQHIVTNRVVSHILLRAKSNNGPVASLLICWPIV